MKRIFYVVLLLLMTVGITGAANYPYVSQQGNGIVWINFISPQNSTLACIWQIKQDGTEYLSQCVRTDHVGAYAAQVPLDNTSPIVEFSDTFRVDTYPNGNRSSATVQQYQVTNPKVLWISRTVIEISVMPRSSTVTLICYSKQSKAYGYVSLGCLDITNRLERATYRVGEPFTNYSYAPSQDDIYSIEQHDQDGITRETVMISNQKPTYNQNLPIVVR